MRSLLRPRRVCHFYTSFPNYCAMKTLGTHFRVNKECIIQSEDQAIFPWSSSSSCPRAEQSKLHEATQTFPVLSPASLLPSNTGCPCSPHSSCRAKTCSEVGSSLGFPNALKGPRPTALIHVRRFPLNQIMTFYLLQNESL